MSLSKADPPQTPQTVTMAALPEIIHGPSMCFCQRSLCPYLMCSKTPSCDFFQWVDILRTKKVNETHNLLQPSQSFGGRPAAITAIPPFSSPSTLPGPQLPGSVPFCLPLPIPRTPTPNKRNWRVQNTAPSPDHVATKVFAEKKKSLTTSFLSFLLQKASSIPRASFSGKRQLVFPSMNLSFWLFCRLLRPRGNQSFRGKNNRVVERLSSLSSCGIFVEFLSWETSVA